MSKKRTVEDLLVNEEFISWVKNTKRDTDSQTDLERKFSCSRENLDKAVRIIESIDFGETAAAPTEIEQTAVLHNILNEIEAYKNRRRKTNLLVQNIAKIAASLILLCGLYYFFAHFSYPKTGNPELAGVERATAKGQKMNLMLPDGTFVKLNAESRISIQDGFGNKERRVLLEGEAFFDVISNKEKPFIIIAGDCETMVLGTSFNINAFDSEQGIRIAVKTGLVSVKIKDIQDTIKVSEDQLLVFDKPTGATTITGFNDYEELGWKDNILYFKNADFDEIRSKLERWYGVSFETGAIRPIESFSGTFYGVSLEKTLDAINYTSNYSYKLKNNVVYVEKND